MEDQPELSCTSGEADRKHEVGGSNIFFKVAQRRGALFSASWTSARKKSETCIAVLVLTYCPTFVDGEHGLAGRQSRLAHL